jgi:hypothetical protein
LAHKASHATGGTDALAPSDIGAQSVFVVEQLTITTSAQVNLTAARAKIFDIVQYAGTQVDVKLPSTDAQNADTFVFRWATGSDSIRIINSSSPSPVATVASGQQVRVIRGITDNWSVVPVDTHTHPASAISDSTTAGRALLTGADAAAQRTSLGLGTLATQSGTFSGTSSGTNTGDQTVGTTAGTVAAGDDSRFHTRSHTLTSTSDHTATANRVFYSDNSGNIQEVALGASGTILTSAGATSAPTFSAASAGGTKTYAFFAAIGSNQPPATNFAVLDTRNSIAVLGFRGETADDSAIFVGVMPEGAVLSSGLQVRLHWMSATQTSNNVRWQAHFQRCDSGTDLDSDSFDANASNEATGTASSTLGAPTVTTITCGSGAIDGIVAGDAYRLRITREQSDTTLDTMSGLAQLIAVEIRSAA